MSIETEDAKKKKPVKAMPMKPSQMPKAMPKRMPADRPMKKSCE